MRACPWIIANWKMHGTRREAAALASAVAAHAAALPSLAGHIVLCPPFTLIHTAADALRGSQVALGAQDCSPEPRGAFTGDTSADMLAEAGCAFVLTGHSERRQNHAESNAQVKAKAEGALRAGLVPVVCVGETWEERQGGRHLEAVAAQVRESVPCEGKAQGARFLIAYEPVWAIGSGRVPASAEISEMHNHIASVLSCVKSGGGLAGDGLCAPVLYGGSVKASNAGEILALEGVGGVLVGGASLVSEDFCTILSAAVSAR